MQVTDSPLLTSGVVAGSWIAGAAVSARLLWRGISAKWRARARDIGDAVAERAMHIVARERLPRIS
jgi:hypothetical protein